MLDEMEISKMKNFDPYLASKLLSPEPNTAHILEITHGGIYASLISTLEHGLYDDFSVDPLS